MNHLILFAHPNPQSFGAGIRDTVVQAAQAQGHQVVVRDLYQIGFAPVLTGQDILSFRAGQVPDDIAEEQGHIRWADLITVLYPLWWAGLPAILKGYIDRVFSYGFAYAFGEAGVEPLLTGKKVLLITTTGSPEPLYQSLGMFEALNKTSNLGIFQFCGIEVLDHHYLTGVISSTPAEREAMLAKVQEAIAAL